MAGGGDDLAGIDDNACIGASIDPTRTGLYTMENVEDMNRLHPGRTSQDVQNALITCNFMRYPSPCSTRQRHPQRRSGPPAALR